MPTLSLRSSELMRGGGERKKRNGESFPHPLPGPLPGLRAPSEAETGMLARHAPRPAPSTWPDPKVSPQDGPVPAALGMGRAGGGQIWFLLDEEGWLHPKSHL